MSAINYGEDNEPKEIVRSDKKSSTPLLNQYGRNLTQMAADGLLDPVYGREEEINEIVNVLNKRKKNNPILVGDPGVGKTVIVEALAQKIQKEDVAFWLLDKQIIEINMTNMVSGTKYRGEFEQRMESLIEEIENNPNIIIFIDEIHNVIGAGGSSGSLDAANIIKPSLSRGTIKCIGATTTEEYAKHIENEGAFERRFQKIYIGEPDKREVFDLLMNIKFKYENFHGVSYSEEIIKKTIELADKYVNYRKFPDKAIDLMDEVGSMVKVTSVEVPREVGDLQKELVGATKNKSKASDSQQFELAASWRDRERITLKKLETLKRELRENIGENKISIGVEDLATIVASHTGIPIKKLTNSESNKLKGLENELLKNLIGQNKPVKKVVESVQRSRLGFGDPNKPIASILMLGSTGVGKTYLAKLLAKYLFDSPESFVRIDMSEYDGAHSISKLIGSPPGYVGYESKGQLTEKIKNRPYSLVLFDEIEKAHPDVSNILLQILDDGKLTDATGGEINFKNTIIMMTSNVGTKNIIEDSSVGFGVDRNVLTVDEGMVFKELGKVFKPEFINRIDEKIIFNPLGREEIKKIAAIEVKIAMERVEHNGYSISYGDDLVDFIAETGFDKKFGARPIKRDINDKIINLITREVLEERVNDKSRFQLVVEKNEIKIKKKRNARNSSK